MHKPLPALCTQTAASLCRMLAAGEVTSAAIVTAYLQATKLREPAVHAYLEVFAEEALAQAAQSDARRKANQALSALDGVPIAVKDNLVIRGHICSCASKMLESFRSPYDATVIQRIRAAGMPLLGRLNMDEFAMGGSTENSAFCATRNPWNLACVPGGSSGGSAAAVAAGMVPWALGSDTGGSVRQPASFCGVVGVKPAYGAVSRYGLVAFASSLDQVGTLTQTCEDAALLLQVICGHDTRDATSDPALCFEPDCFPPCGDLRGLTLGLPLECFDDGLNADVRSAVLCAVENLRKQGAEVRELSIPALRYALPAYYVLSSAEASSNLARYDGVRYGHRADEYADLDTLYRQSRSEALGAEVQRRIMLGTFALSSGYQEQYYRKAQAARERIRQELNEAFSTYDVLLSPVAPSPAYPLGEKSADPLAMISGDCYTVSANIAGLPALSVPCGFSGGGLPIGLGMMCARGGMALLLRAATAVEREQPESTRKPPHTAFEKGCAQ
ncbi:MAG: Asp-tRNA(Asn)/Glu-tRNA(Gln) amidotransferase subunit GatA [Clostridia bacterium]